jgi:hypothetical protein
MEARRACALGRRHGLGHDAAALDGDGRRGHEALVQLSRAVGGLRLGDDAERELFQQLGSRQEDRGAENVEQGVHDRDAELIGRMVHELEMEERVQKRKDGEPEHGAEHVEA